MYVHRTVVRSYEYIESMEVRVRKIEDMGLSCPFYRGSFLYNDSVQAAKGKVGKTGRNGG